MSHHYRREDEEVNKILEAFKPQPLGATGNFPDGKLTEHDEGELTFAVGNLNNRIVINFGKPVKSIGLTKAEALQLASTIIKQAKGIL